MVIGHHLHGSGPVHVIVLHGWMGDYTVFNSMLPALDTEKFTFAFMDYRGYGRSKEMAGEHTMAEIGADAIALADHLGWNTFHLVGHSMGGMATQWIALKHAARVKSIIAVTPVPASGYPMDDQTLGLFSGAADHPANRGTIVMFTTGNRHSAAWERSMTAESLATTTRDAFDDYFRAWVFTNFASEAKGKIKTPMKVLVGEFDPALSAEVIRDTFLQWYPNAQMEILSNAGHYPMVEIPINLAKIWEDFISAHE